MDTVVVLRDLAEELGMDRSRLRRYVLDMGIEPARVRDQKGRNQAMLAITAEEADRVRQHRSDAGYNAGEVARIVQASQGFFYVARMDGQTRPNRVKFGFTLSLDSRMEAYRTSSPEVELLSSWPCKRTWESTILDSLAVKDGCVNVSGEVFDVEDIEDVLHHLTKFFELLGIYSKHVPLLTSLV